jgi:hypothetical protein
MRVVDFEEHAWFLLEEDGGLFVDANCSHSFFGYNFTIELDDLERSRYDIEGRPYIAMLARTIQDTSPISKDSVSPFVGRAVSPKYDERITAAIVQWRQEHGK